MRGIGRFQSLPDYLDRARTRHSKPLTNADTTVPEMCGCLTGLERALMELGNWQGTTAELLDELRHTMVSDPAGSPSVLSLILRVTARAMAWKGIVVSVERRVGMPKLLHIDIVSPGCGNLQCGSRHGEPQGNMPNRTVLASLWG